MRRALVIGATAKMMGDTVRVTSNGRDVTGKHRIDNGRIDAIELGTSVHYPVGSEVTVALPPALCWAYPTREDAGGLALGRRRRRRDAGNTTEVGPVLGAGDRGGGHCPSS